MTNADDVLMEMFRFQMMSFRINPYSAGDFPLLNNQVLNHYPRTITHGMRHGQEVDSIDRGYDGGDRGQEQSPGPYYYLTLLCGEELSE